MRYTQDDVCKRIILAKCCLADFAIRMFDAQAIGDIESENCLLEKALVLKGAIDAMCRWYEPEVLTVVYEYNVVPSGGRATVNSWTFAGTDILSHGDSANYTAGESLADLINARTYTGTTSATAVKTTANRIEVAYTYANVNRGSTPTVSFSTGSITGAEEEAEASVDVDVLPCLDDDQLEGIFNVVDRVCGCNCKDAHSRDFMGEFIS